MAAKKKPASNVVATNRQARRDYEILETWEAGIALQGSEVTIEVTVRHPNVGTFPNTRLTQTISARVPVGFKEIGT